MVIVLALLLFMMKDFAGSMAGFFHTPAFSVDLLAAIVIVLLSPVSYTHLDVYKRQVY